MKLRRRAGKERPASYTIVVMFSKLCLPGNWKLRLKSHASCLTSNFTDFIFPLHFQLAEQMQVSPVIELPTQVTEVIPASTSATVPGQPLTSSSLEGFLIVLESETPLADGYILSGSYQWSDPRFGMEAVQINDPKISDANGQEVVFEAVDPAVPIDPALKKVPFAYQIHGKDYAWPLTIAVNSVTVNLPEEGLFQFDAGTNPQVGQTWEVNIDVPVAGHIIHVQTIQLTAGRAPSELGFTFTMTADPGVMGASIHDIDPVINNGAGGGGGGGSGGENASAAGPFSYGWALEGYSPAGGKTFAVSNIAVMFNGTWQATWQPSTK